jgi:hypothetical protein
LDKGSKFPWFVVSHLPPDPLSRLVRGGIEPL